MFLKNFLVESVDRISKDFKQRELLPLKLVFFVQASTISVLYPYLTIHMRELGINVEEAAIMSAVIPVIGIIMPPLAGMVADKIGNFKLLLSLFSLIGGLAALLLLLVPVGRVTVTYPEKITLSMGCSEISGGNGSDHRFGVFEIGLSNEISCDLVPGLKDPNMTHFDLNFVKLEGCGFVCRNLNNTNANESEKTGYTKVIWDGTMDPILTGRSYAIQIKTPTGIKSYHYNLLKDDLPVRQAKKDILAHRLKFSEAPLTTSIRKLARSTYFFPATEFARLICKKMNLKSRREERSETHVCHVGVNENDELNDLSSTVNTSFKWGVRRQLDEFTIGGLNEFVSDFGHWFSGKESRTPKGKFSCGNFQKSDVTAFVYLHNPDDNVEVLETLPLSECRPRCLLSSLRKSLCTNLKEEVIYDPKLTFWTYLAIRVFIGIIGSTSYAMYEVAVISILRENKADYGLQRIYASIGGMIASPISGMLIDYASRGKRRTDFRPAFYLYTALKVSTSILLLFINLEFKKAAEHVISDACKVLKNVEVIALLVVCFVLGTAWGYIESFLFWFLEDLGGSRSLMGITIFVGGVAGIPLLVLSGPIIRKIGHANVLILGLLFYGVRLIGYSVIYNPYHCLFFEAMESVTSALAFTAAVTYAAKLSTTTTDGSVQGLVGGLYFGVGRGAGSLIGGYLMEAFGTRETYRIFSVFSVSISLVYYLFNQFYIRKRPQTEGNDICKESPSNDNKDSNVLAINDKTNDSFSDKEREKAEKDSFKANDEKNSKERQSHKNPAYVHDIEEERKND